MYFSSSTNSNKRIDLYNDTETNLKTERLNNTDNSLNFDKIVKDLYDHDRIALLLFISTREVDIICIGYKHTTKDKKTLKE